MIGFQFIAGLIVGTGVAFWAIHDHRRETQGRSRRPTQAEASAHRLGMVDGLQEAEGILSTLEQNTRERSLAAEKAHDYPLFDQMWHSAGGVTDARRLILERRLYHQGELDRGTP